ncbi:cyclic nucleotide-binding protein [Elizabethkingia miricola]|uniref:CRP-like cAMP-binding protein n=1 Tax=Elizabethkingia miricola TaxID=172045 RepID=A0ABY3NLH8_ELIMR|nr:MULTISPECIES: Crp/Fnr family transcriptional regulator [Elizabethkingia]OBS13681.1 cyclic nucleotide-binding protein [Elizabethkingia miricola]TYO94058.1 CRP-like cAMP-binding protein [Elizabethkingia miricola]
MFQIFRAHVDKFIEIDDQEFKKISSFFRVKRFRKKEDLMTAGEICRYHFFVLKGCLRKFYITSKGSEQTTEFAIENWWLTDNMVYEHQLRTDFSIQAVENSEVLVIEHQDQERLLKEYPVMERYFRYVYQRSYAAAQMRVRYIYTFSKEEMYLHFLEQQPQFVQRIPQYLIASFLGLTPEYLSEIRAKKIS